MENNSETSQFLKEIVLKQLEAHLNEMFKVQVGEIWKEVVQPEKITVEKMRLEILNELSQWDLERLTKFLMENPVRKPRGMNGGRKKTMTDEDPLELPIGNLAQDSNGQEFIEKKLTLMNEPKPRTKSTIDL